jgi:hypothetical protein
MGHPARSTASPSASAAALRIGYDRASTNAQYLAAQRRALAALGSGHPQPTKCSRPSEEEP